MDDKRKVIDIYKINRHGEISKLYKAGADIESLAANYNTSIETMTVVIGTLGHDVPDEYNHHVAEKLQDIKTWNKERPKRKMTRSVDLYMNDSTKASIDTAYVEGKTIKDLAGQYKVSHNTMMIVIGMIGYPVDNWCAKPIADKLAYVDKMRAKRVKTK